MFKRFTFFLLLAIPFLFVTSSILAATLQLTSIGTVSTGGNQYSTWWYTGANPILRGSASPNAVVTVTIDSLAQTATADASGTWVFTPTTLNEGDHQIVLSADGEQYSFTLSITASPPTEFDSLTSSGSAVSSGSGVPNDLPVSGNIEITLALIGFATLLIGGGFVLARKAA